ncbi:MAG: hypothetical protein HND48_19180 [Chloroflexi bacterium]|nr:hypothetical protein [Chloroflexota bacterium]
MSLLWLIFNHADAWIVTLVVSAVSLALRGRLDGAALGIPIMLALGAWLAFAINDRCDAQVDASDPRKAHRSVFSRPAPRTDDRDPRDRRRAGDRGVRRVRPTRMGHRGDCAGCVLGVFRAAAAPEGRGPAGICLHTPRWSNPCRMSRRSGWLTRR